jgi:hypothetical protein
MMMPTVNPQSFTVTDANAAAEAVTTFSVLVGTTPGGPYATSKATIPLNTMTNAGGAYTAPFSALTFNPALSQFTTYYAVSQAVNAQGSSGNSPEASFQIEALPTAPTALSFA